MPQRLRAGGRFPGAEPTARTRPVASSAATSRYLQGETEPPLEFIDAAAVVLDVDPAWLAFGIDSARQEVGEHAEAADEMRDRQRYDAWRLKLNVLNAMGVLPKQLRLEAMPGRIESGDDFLGFAQRANVGYLPPWVAAVAEIRARYGRDTIDPATLGRALRGPLEAVGIDPAAGADRTYRTQEWLDDYIAGMVPVLLALGPERKRQRDATAKEEDENG